LGGTNDRAEGMEDNGIDDLNQAIMRAETKFITPKPLKESIDERMAIYLEESQGARIAAYINVGGGVASVGSSKNKRMFEPGLNMRLPAKSTKEDGVMNRFSKEGVPVIHLSYVDK